MLKCATFCFVVCVLYVLWACAHAVSRECLFFVCGWLWWYPPPTVWVLWNEMWEATATLFILWILTILYSSVPHQFAVLQFVFTLHKYRFSFHVLQKAFIRQCHLWTSFVVVIIITWSTHCEARPAFFRARLELHECSELCRNCFWA